MHVDLLNVHFCGNPVAEGQTLFQKQATCSGGDMLPSLEYLKLRLICPWIPYGSLVDLLLRECMCLTSTTPEARPHTKLFDKVSGTKGQSGIQSLTRG